MIIDAHTHIYPEKIAAKAIEKLEKNSGVKAKTNGIESGLRESMKEAGIDYSLLLPVATSAKQVDTINEVAARTNDAAKETGILSFGGIHPDTENYKEVLRRVKSYGLKGVKLHPDYQETFFNDIRYKRIVEEATSLDLFLVIHAGVDIGLPEPVHCTPEHVVEVVRDTKSDHLILAHMGGWRLWDEVQEKLLGLPVYFDTSFSGDYLEADGVNGMLTKEAFTNLVRAMGTDRVLFGTDSPWSGQKEAVQWLRDTTLTEEEKQQIFAGNFQRIIGV